MPNDSDQLAGIERAIGRLQGGVDGLDKSLTAHRAETTRATDGLHKRISNEVGKVAGDVEVLKADAAGDKAVASFKRSLGYVLTGSFGAAALELGRWLAALGEG